MLKNPHTKHPYTHLIIGVKGLLQDEHFELSQRPVIGQLLSQHTDSHPNFRVVDRLKSFATEPPYHSPTSHCGFIVTAERERGREGGEGREEEGERGGRGEKRRERGGRKRRKREGKRGSELVSKR